MSDTIQTPPWDQLILPLLELAQQAELTRKLAYEVLPSRMNLSQEAIEERLNSGALRINNRIGWAMSHLTKANLIEKIRGATYGITNAGRTFLERHRGKPFTHHALQKIDGYQEAWQKAVDSNPVTSIPTLPISHNATPVEAIESAAEEIESALRDEILELLATTDPIRFERIVLDLLFAMGYGGSRKEAAQMTSRSNDEGIDGIINEDRLGLDVVYIQAKRWQNTVGRKEVQSFVGALAGKQANKGVFITTSNYSKNALGFANNVSQKVILIDGNRLANLMIEHNIGASIDRVVEIKKIDSDYFEES